MDMMTCGTLTHVDGRVVETGSPLEIVATRRELQYLREAQRRSGRPGIGLLAAQSSVSELGDLAVANPAYLRPCDSHLVPMLNELKIENHITREPEQVKAFRDTWRDGSHSYLTYLRDRLTVARVLLTDSGDLVLDPTCGSGTTATVAEQWGRRWITIDTSRWRWRWPVPASWARVIRFTCWPIPATAR